MKNKCPFLLLSISLGFLFAFRPDATIFYYGFNEKIILKQNDTKLVVRLKSVDKSDSLIAKAKSFKWHDSKTLELSFPSKELRNQLLNSSNAVKEIVSINPVYTVGDKTERLITNEILIQFKNSIKISTLQSIIKKYGLTLIDENPIFKRFTVPDKGNALEIANDIQESGMTVFSHPNFMSELTPNSIPNDTYFDKQYYLHNTGQTVNGNSGTSNADINIPEAWDISTGSSNVIVSIIDCGLTSDHPDLPNSRQVRLNGSNFATDGTVNDPSPLAYFDGGHGNAVSGIIAATKDNNEGIAGICPNCKVLPIRIFNANRGPASDSQVANAILFAADNGAWIINNSWSYDSDNPNLVPAIVSAISYATTQGRGGKGCVVVFSLGNYADHTAGSNYAGYISFPSNVNISGVLTVGASEATDHQANYSGTANPSSANNQVIDVVAPSAPYLDYLDVWSMDSPSNLGINPVPANYFSINPGTVNPSTGSNNLSYTAYFGGTSVSAAEVSGVAALILSVNPNLTQQQVYDIITSTADKVGGYTYTNGRSNQLGFGRLNACVAVAQALNSIITLSAPSIICTTGQFSVQNLPSGISVSWSSSSPDVSINSSGLATRLNNYSGNVIITATVSTACANFVLTSTTVIVGNPTYSGVSIVRDINDPNQNVSYVYTYSNAVQFYVSAASAVNNYQWTITSDQSCGSSGPKFYSNGNGTQATTTANTINVNTGTCSGTFWIQCKAVNNCGETYYSARLFSVTNSGGGGCDYSLTTSPNPSKIGGDVTINLVPPPPGCDNSVTTLNAQESTGSSSDEISRVTIIDNSGNPMYHETSTGISHVLNTVNLHRGTYYFLKVLTIQGRTFQIRILKD